MPDLENMTMPKLKELAKQFDIKNISKLKKDELIEVLNAKYEENNNSSSEDNKILTEESKELNEKHYDENGEPIVDYKLTNDGDEIVEGILDILPDGYGFLRGENLIQVM